MTPRTAVAADAQEGNLSDTVAESPQGAAPVGRHRTGPQTVHDWTDALRGEHPDSRPTAAVLYRCLWLLEERGKPADRAQVAASIRLWLGAA